jgi:predicted RNase H-like HicB family nuclease
VEYIYDHEVQSWGFAVPALHIVGSADTRAEARQQALEAIAFALEVEPGHDAVLPGAEVEMLDLALDPSTAA